MCLKMAFLEKRQLNLTTNHHREGLKTVQKICFQVKHTVLFFFLLFHCYFFIAYFSLIFIIYIFFIFSSVFHMKKSSSQYDLLFSSSGEIFFCVAVIVMIDLFYFTYFTVELYCFSWLPELYKYTPCPIPKKFSLSTETRFHWISHPTESMVVQNIGL